MPLPQLTHLQFLIVEVLLLSGESPGLTIREKLAGEMVRMSGPAFYALMARMERAGWITGEYRTTRVAGVTLKERRYKVTGAGRDAWHGVRDFYQLSRNPAAEPAR